MAVATLSEALDNLYTTTWFEMKGEAVDNIFDATPFWFWARANGMLVPVRGGRRLTEALRYAKSDNVAWITKGDTAALDDKEHLTMAVDDWRYLIDSIVRFGIDDQQNSGKFMIINLMKSKLATAQDSLIDTLETALFGSQSGKTMNGLLDIVPDDPTTGVVSGIDPATYTWWRSKTKDMTGLSFAVNGVPEMRTLLNNCRNNLRSDSPDIIVSGQTPNEYYEDSVVEQKQIFNKKLGDAGFETIEFKGLPMVWSPACDNGRMYFINTKYLVLKYDPAMFFDMTAWKDIPNQVNDRAAQIITACNLMSSRRRTHGVLHTIDTA